MPSPGIKAPAPLDGSCNRVRGRAHHRMPFAQCDGQSASQRSEALWQSCGNEGTDPAAGSPVSVMAGVSVAGC